MIIHIHLDNVFFSSLSLSLSLWLIIIKFFPFFSLCLINQAYAYTFMFAFNWCLTIYIYIYIYIWIERKASNKFLTLVLHAYITNILLKVIREFTEIYSTRIWYKSEITLNCKNVFSFILSAYICVFIYLSIYIYIYLYKV
jgi:hypothetical protein